jgi:EAL domain-containing protein (putative c-di-GMP-specific phosphodiesterase class I)
MGRNLKQRVIAENVETPEQFAFHLARLCDEEQGFHFSPPLSAEGFAPLHITWNDALPRRRPGCAE